MWRLFDADEKNPLKNRIWKKNSKWVEVLKKVWYNIRA